MKKRIRLAFRSVSGKMFGLFWLCMVMGIALGLTPDASFAQSVTPPANTTIGNQASATYIDSNGNTRTVTSNTVETTVQQVYAVTITPGVTKTVSPGGQVSFPHTLTNNGNGADSFNLATLNESGDYSFDNAAIYADANGDGIPDDINDPITVTPNVAGGGQFSFVIVADVPTSTSNGDSDSFDIKGTSTNDGSQSDTQSNTATVSSGAVIDVIKSINPSTGAPGQTVTVKLTFTNNGNTDGTNLVINDPLPAGFDYVLASGKWSGSGTNLGDNTGNGDDPAGITYEYDGSANGGDGQVTATIADLSAGQQGTLSFDVKVDNGFTGRTINNTANYTHDDLTGNQNTNTATFQVAQDYGVAIVAPATVTVASASQGATVDFVNTFTNTGSISDRYNITLDNSTFPQGTSFTLYQSDGSGNPTSPLTDSNNDGIPDVGPVASSDNFEVIVRASLPSNATSGPYTIEKTATSVGDPSKTAIHTDELTAITDNKIDLTNNAAIGGTGVTGVGVATSGEATAQTTEPADPATNARFTLFVNNTGGQQDNYDLSASTDGSDFTQGLPSGWTVDFQNTNGNSITNTGPISAGGNIEVTAIISVPQDANAGEQAIYFRAKSASTGIYDVKHDAVQVNTVRNITLVTSQNGQIAPGGSKIYTHSLTNNGNVDENDGTNSRIELELANSASSGFTSIVYIDNNGDGQIDSGDELVTSAGNTIDLPTVGTLAPGDKVDLLIKVTAGSGVSDGTTNTTTLTARDNGTDPGVGVNGVNLNTASTQDITTVVAGNLVITKEQSLDGTTYGTAKLNADPGDVVYYRITVTNKGSSAVTTVDITDGTPAYTKQNGAVSVSGSGSPSIDSEAGDGNAGTIEVSSASLGAGQSFTIDFAVQINN